MAELSALDEANYEVEASVEYNTSLYEREPEFWSEREATDPYWPPPEVDPFEAATDLEAVFCDHSQMLECHDGCGHFSCPCGLFWDEGSEGGDGGFDPDNDYDLFEE